MFHSLDIVTLIRVCKPFVTLAARIFMSRLFKMEGNTNSLRGAPRDTKPATCCNQHTTHKQHTAQHNKSVTSSRVHSVTKSINCYQFVLINIRKHLTITTYTTTYNVIHKSIERSSAKCSPKEKADVVHLQKSLTREAIPGVSDLTSRNYPASRSCHTSTTIASPYETKPLPPK